MTAVTLGAAESLVLIGDARRAAVTITNTDGANAAYLRIQARNTGTTTSTNFSYYLQAGQTFTAQREVHGAELTCSTIWGLAAAGTPILAVEATQVRTGAATIVR